MEKYENDVVGKLSHETINITLCTPITTLIYYHDRSDGTRSYNRCFRLKMDILFIFTNIIYEHDTLF